MLFELFKQIRTVLAEAYHVEFDSYGIVRTSDDTMTRPEPLHCLQPHPSTLPLPPHTRHTATCGGTVFSRRHGYPSPFFLTSSAFVLLDIIFNKTSYFMFFIFL